MIPSISWESSTSFPNQVLSLALIGEDIHLLTNHSALASTTDAYLRQPVRFDGAAVVRLTNALHSESQYVSGIWHHDRCGRRIKAFLFLNDVEPDGRPTHRSRVEDRASTRVERGKHLVRP